ncbi:CBS domain-containing protein [Halorubellus sp. PRR65]|uniref:CBS domain-containing protein n=1 Tax=Halorubellus sp. PRR65 TaxID=3098148 RepID=UPI002B25800B|nr:CBS domain-containing protein [Halorubellus sp. PRR65]
MIDVPVVQAMDERAPVVGSHRPIPEAAELLRDSAVPALVVRDGSDVVTGIVTEADVVAAVAEGAATHTVASCMSTPVVTVTPSTPVGLAADRMRKAGISLLAVVDDGEYLGLATRETLAPHVARHRLDVTWDAEPLRVDRDQPDASRDDQETADTA